MLDVIITAAVKVAATLLITLIGVLGAWLTSQLAEHAKLKNISMAVHTLEVMAIQTAGELEQTMVRPLKEAAADHKLSREEVTQLGMMLYNITHKKMSKPMMDLLEAAGVDIQAVITSAAEDWINSVRPAALVSDVQTAAVGFEVEA